MSEEDVTDSDGPDCHPDKNDKSVTQNQIVKILRRHACVNYGSR